MMKTGNYLNLLFFIAVVPLISCDKEDNNNNKNQAFDEFCSVAPDGWECNIITGDFQIQDIPQNADTPVVIIKYCNPNVKFTRIPGSEVNPSLILDLYEIEQKEELLDLIVSQLMFSWCIPAYYGETKDYFILTSPCFINGGCYSEEANASISALHEALKSIITINDYNSF